MSQIKTTPTMHQLEILALELLAGGLKVRKDYHDLVTRILTDPTYCALDDLKLVGPESDLFCGSQRCWYEIFDVHTSGATRYSVRATMMLAWSIVLYRCELAADLDPIYRYEPETPIRLATDRLREAILNYVVEEQRIGRERAELDEEQIELDREQAALCII